MQPRSRTKAALPGTSTLLALGLFGLGLPGCSTFVTTFGEEVQSNLAFSGTRRNIRSQRKFVAGQEADDNHELAAISILEMSLIDLPFSFVTDLVFLPVTLPLTLYRRGQEPNASQPADSEGPTS